MHGLLGGGAGGGQHAGDAGLLVGAVEDGPQRPQVSRGQQVVLGDRGGLDAGEGEQEEGGQAGAVAAGAAVHHDRAGPGDGDGVDQFGDGVPAVVEVGAEGQRGAVEAAEPGPPGGAGQRVQRHPDQVDGVGGGQQRPVLDGVSQVDDGAHAVVEQRVLALGGEPVEVVGADDRAGAGAPSVAGGQAAQVADVQAAVPVEPALLVQ